MTGWHTGPMTAFDTETTGVDPETARIITATVVQITPGDQPGWQTWLLNHPGVTIPEAATKVHGITTEHMREHGEEPTGALVEIVRALQAGKRTGGPLVIMNAPYDLTVLARNCARFGLDSWQHGPVVDPMVIDRTLDKYRRGSRKLVDLCNHYGVRLEGAHSSVGDALGAARVAWRIAQHLSTPDGRLVGAVPLDELQQLQANWHEAWAVGFREYLRKQGKPADDVSGEWPIRRSRVGVGR